MTGTRALLAIAIPLLLASAAPAAEPPDLGTYREFALGASIDEVAAVTGTTAEDVKIVHARPSLIQELTWRPRYTIGRSLTPDSAREIRFQFFDGELFEIVVLYDAHELEGLTAPDLVKAISGVYGAPAVRRGAAIARWQDAEVSITLTEDSYPSPYRLTLVRLALVQRAAAASAEGERLDRLEAPAKEALRLAADAKQRRVDDAATREKNKDGFRP